MTISKYQIIEAIPMVLAVGLLILSRMVYPICATNVRCFENLLLASSSVGSIGSLILYNWFKKSKLLDKLNWTKTRLVAAIVCWGFLFLVVAIRKIL